MAGSWCKIANIYAKNLQMFMQSPGVLMWYFVIFSEIKRQPVEEWAVFFKQIYWVDILYNLNAILKSTCASDTDFTD